ncbi:MAG TPA: peptidoglycan-associated lipoprotein Pal [Gemmatimonadaceae bacterium]|nr:peptidoglycan-associated lipoprotein Pal [Gemmatimonadaceae bacterium]
MRFVAKLAVAASSIVWVAACHRSQPAAAPTPTPVTRVNQDSINRANFVRDSIAQADASRRLAAARADSIRRANEARAAELTGARAALTQPIHFDFDASEILDADKPVLDRKAGVLGANRPVRIRIEGNTDERGSDEYNLALGMRRAAAAKLYLTQRGIDAGRIETVSYGEERPVCQEHDESCWAKNRRAEFAVLAGDVTTIVPER